MVARSGLQGLRISPSLGEFGTPFSIAPRQKGDCSIRPLNLRSKLEFR